MAENVKEKKKVNKLVIILIFTVTLVAAFVSYAYTTQQFFFHKDEKKEIPEYTLSLDNFVVNLKDSRSNRYLKTKIVLGYKDKKAIKELEMKKPNIQDTAIRMLRSKSREDITSVEGTDKLKVQMQEEINKIFSQDLITHVYITDFLIQ